MGGCIGKQPDSKVCFKCGSLLPKQKPLTPHHCALAKPVIYLKQEVPTPCPDLQSVREKAVLDAHQKMKIKVPRNKNKTLFEWKEEQALFYPPEIKNISRETIRHAKFQQKLTWFRMHLETHRISWQKGSEVLKVDRWNILFSSLAGLKGKNLYKELKIQFSDEKVDDAGGLLREWMHLCIKQIMSRETGIFRQCDTDETAYKFIWDKNVVEEVALQAINLLGVIIAKALFQRVSLNCYLDRTILRQLCSQPVHIQDVYSHDKQLYKSWSSILTMPDASQLHLDGCVYHTHGENDLEQYELFPNGKNTLINNNNRNFYITEIIHLHCTKSVENYLRALLTSVFSLIPAELLSIFQPHQMEMILNGPFKIDAADWKAHTVYEGVKADSKLAKWFWESVEKYDQEKLKNLLHYCTGSARVPILGFKYLQSNRGQIRPFTIRKVQYTAANPYPKSHTCFNRLQLPDYSSKQQLDEKMKQITDQELNHFGLS